MQSDSLSLNSQYKYVVIGDSIPLEISGGNGLITFTISPNAGSINPSNWYVAPTTIVKDSIDIQIKASDVNDSKSLGITIVRAQTIDSTLSFSKHILPILESNCNFKACHGQNDAAGNVNLESYEAALRHIQPYKAENSILYQSLIKPDPLRRMPPSGPLHIYKIQAIHKWIEQGCFNN